MANAETPIDPMMTPLQVSERERLSNLDDLSFAVMWLRDASDVDPLGLHWFNINWKPDYTASKQEQRASAKRFLARHARAFKRLGKVEKRSDDYQYEVYVDVGSVRFRAVAISSAVCELVDTGEFDVIPAKPAEPAKTVPKLKKVCPPSLLAGVFDDERRIEAKLAEKTEVA